MTNPAHKALKRFLFSLCMLTILLLATDIPFAHAEMEDHPYVRLQSLDKVTARTITFDAKVGSTIKFGTIFIKIRACRKAPPMEQPESAAFLQVWEISAEEEAEWIFSGWMFSSSPALSPMDHPIYDVWVIDCLTEEEGKKSKEEEEPEEDNTEQSAE
jgi:hypothetical protein